MGVSDTTEKDWEEHYKEYLASVTEEYKIGYNKAIDDFAEQLRVHYALLQERGYVAETFEKLMKNVFEYAEQLKGGGIND